MGRLSLIRESEIALVVMDPIEIDAKGERSS